MDYNHHVQRDTFEEEDTTDNSRSIFIGGIPLASTQNQILNYLEAYAPVESLSIPKDRFTKKPKGYAKAVFTTEEGALHMLHAENPHKIGGLPVGVNLWRKQDEYSK